MNVRSQHIDKPAFQLKGSMLTLSVLQILHLDYATFQQQLAEMIQKNANFFQHMPVIIDLQKIHSQNDDINFEEINALLRKNGLVPIGIIHANPGQVAAATHAGLGILPDTKTTQMSKVPKKGERSKIVTAPVRSGQQIYAKQCDLIILASVSNGAEILADGNIHVYGTLRGRAIAGATGDTQARIFCQKLEAELVSVAGYYKLQEELASVDNTTSTQILLEDDQLIISSI